MDPLTIGALSVAALFFLIIIGCHIGVSLMVASYAGVWAITGRPAVAASLLKTTAFSAVADYAFAVIPLFVLMGLLATSAGATRDLFNAAGSMLRAVSGGIGIATVAANAIFAAITGVSVASAAVFSKLAVPEMQRLHYQLRFSLGIVASSALLGMLIPPSILLIVYGVITEQSIGALFAAGIGPGLLVAFALSLAIWAMAKMRPALVGGNARPEDASSASRAEMILRPWPLYLLIALVLGGIYLGWFTPTEAGAVGALGAMAILIGRGAFSLRGMVDLLLETGRASAGIFFLLIAASMYSRMLTLSGLPNAISDWAIHLALPPYAIIVVFIVILLIMGMILDSVSIILLTMPIMVPVVQMLGFDAVWFGIVAIVAIEIGLLTPPFGMVVFAMKSSLPDTVSIEDIYIGSAPFLVVLLTVLAILVVVPSISLAIPNFIY
jgi:C4-dicarboxylate transporter, DctM subunit